MIIRGLTCSCLQLWLLLYTDVALGSPSLLPSCSIIIVSLHITIILTMACLSVFLHLQRLQVHKVGLDAEARARDSSRGGRQVEEELKAEIDRLKGSLARAMADARKWKDMVDQAEGEGMQSVCPAVCGACGGNPLLLQPEKEKENQSAFFMTGDAPTSTSTRVSVEPQDKDKGSNFAAFVALKKENQQLKLQLLHQTQSSLGGGTSSSSSSSSSSSKSGMAKSASGGSVGVFGAKKR